MTAELDVLGTRVISALINGGYQGLLITLLVAAGFRCLSRTNAATRHTVALATLFLVAALPLLHLTRPAPKAGSLGDPFRTPNRTGGSMGDPEQPPIPVVGGPGSSPTFATLPAERHLRRPSSSRVPPSLGRSVESLGLTEGAEVMGAASGSRLGKERSLGRTVGEAQVEGKARAALSTALTTAPASPVQEAPHAAPTDRPNGWLSGIGPALSRVRIDLAAVLPAGAAVWVLAVWLGLATLRLAGLARQYQTLQRLTRSGRPAPGHLSGLFDSLASSLGRGRRPRLLVVPTIATPLAAGFVKPVILLPASVCSEGEQDRLEPVLRHELAHVSRRDVWSNLLQQIIRALFFYHPSVWWLSRRLTVDREIACDDCVLAVTSTPRDYALLLTEFAGRVSGRRLSTALSGWSHPSQLKERIHMILNTRRNSSPVLAKTRAGVLAATTAAITLVAWQAGPRVALAQSSAGTAVDAAASSPAVSVTAVVDGGTAVVTSSGASTGTRATTVARSSRFAAQTLPAATPSSGVNAQAVTPPAVPRGLPDLPDQPAPPVSPLPFLAQVNAPALPAAPAAPYAAWASTAPATAPYGAEEPGDRSLERRIERLERLIESLVGEDGFERSKPGYRANSFNPTSDPRPIPTEPFAWTQLNQDLTKPQPERWPSPDPFQWDAKEKMKLKEKEVENARLQAELALREVERATRESARYGGDAKTYDAAGTGGLGRYTDRETASLDRQRRALEEQQRALQRQLESLERQLQAVAGQIERIERQKSDLFERETSLRERPKQRDPGDSEDAREPGSNAEPAPRPVPEQNN